MEWFEIPKIRQILDGFTTYMLRGKSKRKLEFSLDEGGSSLLTPDSIIVSPNKYRGMPEERQWSLTRADIVHEVAHARFTSRFGNPEKEGKSRLFLYLNKLIEDNRIEYKMVQEEHMGRLLLPKRSFFQLRRTDGKYHGEDAFTQLFLTLFEYSYGIRCNQTSIPRSLGNEEKEKWNQIKPLLDQSFFLGDSEEAIKMAQEVERILLDLEDEEDEPDWKDRATAGGCANLMRDTLGDKPCGEGEVGGGGGEEGDGAEPDDEEGDSEGVGGGEGESGDGEKFSQTWSTRLKTDEEDTIFGDIAEQMLNAQRRLERHGMREDFNRLEQRWLSAGWGGHGSGPINDSLVLRPHDPKMMLKRVNQILPVFLDAFKTVPPLEVADLSRAGGRLSLRDYLVDPTKPFISMLEPKKAMMDLAIRVIVDVSGSMRQAGKATMCALFAMALHRAAQTFGVHYQICTAPLNIRLADSETPVSEGDENIMSICQAPGPHEDFGMILEQHAVELLERDEELKMIICLHDGQSNDHDYLERVVKHYRRKGITIIAVGFPGGGGDSRYYEEMRKALSRQFADDFLIDINLGKIVSNQDGAWRAGRSIFPDEIWAQLRDVPQRLARVIRNFRKRTG